MDVGNTHDHHLLERKVKIQGPYRPRNVAPSIYFKSKSSTSFHSWFFSVWVQNQHTLNWDRFGEDEGWGMPAMCLLQW